MKKLLILMSATLLLFINTGVASAYIKPAYNYDVPFTLQSSKVTLDTSYTYYRVNTYIPATRVDSGRIYSNAVYDFTNSEGENTINFNFSYWYTINYTDGTSRSYDPATSVVPYTGSKTIRDYIGYSRAIKSIVLTYTWKQNGGVTTAELNTLDTFSVDTTPPTPPALTTTLPNGWINHDITVDFVDGVDSELGVDFSHYRSTGATALDWVIGNSFSLHTEGVTNILLATVDRAGLSSSEVSGVIKIDKTPPPAPLISLQ